MPIMPFNELKNKISKYLFYMEKNIRRDVIEIFDSKTF